LTAHEIGHNWNASHCDGDGDCHIMCSAINGCNGIGLPNFGYRAVNEITAHRDSRTCLDDGCGAIMDMTEPDPGIAGQSNTIGVRGATAGATIQFFAGTLAGSTPVPGCAGLSVDIGSAKGLPPVTADSNGNATLSVTVPPGAAGKTLRLQAADETNCTVSDLVIYTFQ
jgi:hypothetical protein